MKSNTLFKNLGRGAGGLALALIAGAVAVTMFFKPMNAAPESQESTKTAPKPTGGETKKATVGGGCFWCVEAIYERVDGVKSAVSGYAAGHVDNPTYEQICTGKTGHAEVVQIEYDPAQVSYEDLLELFWDAHDPTTLNRQGADVGPQYRSIILYHDEEQKRIAEKSKKEAAARFKDPVVTEIQPLETFYPAETYHQDYFQNNPQAGYCVYVIRPKVKQLEEKGKIGKP